MVTLQDVRDLALSLDRVTEGLVAKRVKFRVGRTVWLAFSRDETVMGFAFSKDERDALIASEPAKFLLPEPADLRYNWAVVRLAAIDHEEMTEIVFEAWRFVVPSFIVTRYNARNKAGHL
jgi:hypothetical protein